MDTTNPYAEVASASGAWTCPIRLPSTPMDQVRDALSGLAVTTDVPVAAFAYGRAGDSVVDLMLYRDPSRTHGTPSATECSASVDALVAATGWTAEPDRAPAAGILVGLGLRQGYAPDAHQHHPSEVDRILAAHGTGWQCRPARLVSARRVDTGVRWYCEDGVVIRANAGLLPAITTAAARFQQHRFVVTHVATGRTYVLSQ